jgi:hypothetical protein
MAMTSQIRSAIREFNDIILGGIPFLLERNETAFLSFMCSVAAIDALAAYRYTTGKVGGAVCGLYPRVLSGSYAPHANNLYRLRCRLLHNFSPAYFTLVHASPEKHLQGSQIGDTILSDEVLFTDLRETAQKFFNEVQNDAGRPPPLQKCKTKRLDRVFATSPHYVLSGKCRE